MTPETDRHTTKSAPAAENAFDPAALSPLHAALQELESLLSGVAAPDGGPTSKNADDERAGTDLSERLLDVAAGLASLHPALHDKRLLVRSLLAWEASSGGDAFAGDPSDVLEPEELDEGARRHSEVIGRVWQEKMLDAGAATVALGARPAQHRVLVELRERSRLLALRHGRSHLYPAFQFDLLKRALHPEVELVNQELGAEGDPWGVACWWISPNPRLAGARPIDLVGSNRGEEVVSAARALAQPIG